MKKLKIYLEDDNNEMLDFLYDWVIIIGLLKIEDEIKIESNKRSFKLTIGEVIDGNPSINYAEFDEYTIVTIYESENSQRQYLVQEQIDLMEFDEITEEELSRGDKQIIWHAINRMP